MAKEPETSPVYRSLKGTLDIQNRRLENRNRAEESLKVAENELDRIEKQVTLITEETTVSSDPEVLSVRLDGVIQSLQGTTQWMSEHGEFFSSLETDPGSGQCAKPNQGVNHGTLFTGLGSNHAGDFSGGSHQPICYYRKHS